MGKPASGSAWLSGLEKEFAVFAFTAIGFLAWAFFCATVGLGFPNLEIEQYAMAALYTTMHTVAILGVVILLAILAAASLRHAPESWDKVPWLLLGIRVARWIAWTLMCLVLASALLKSLKLLNVAWPIGTAFVLWGIVLLSIESLSKLAKAGQFVTFLWHLFYSMVAVVSAPLAFLGMVKLQGLRASEFELFAGAALTTLPGLLLAFRPPFKMRRYPLEPAERKEREARSNGEQVMLKFGVKKLRFSKFRLADGPPLVFDRAEMVFPVLFTLLLTSASTGIAVLPNTPTTLGGGQLRQAKLLMSPSLLDNESREAFFDSDVAGSAGVEISKTVTVVFSNSEWYFIRIPPNDARNDKSYEVRRDAVVGVLWH